MSTHIHTHMELEQSIQDMMHIRLRLKNVTHSIVGAQPPTVACKVEAQLEHMHIAYMFLHVWRQFACSVGAH